MQNLLKKISKKVNIDIINLEKLFERELLTTNNAIYRDVLVLNESMTAFILFGSYFYRIFC